MEQGYLFMNTNLFSVSFRDFDDFRRESFLCDVFLETEDKQGTSIPAHRLVLSSISEYFKLMFSTDMIEKNKENIVIRDMDFSTLQALVDYCYSGKVFISPKNIQDLLRASHLAQFDGIVTACFDFLKNNMDTMNCLSIIYLADKYSMDSVREEALSYARRHFPAVSQSEEFLELDMQYLNDLITSDKLNVASESDVYFAILGWVKHDLSTRLSSLENLLSTVRFPLLTRKFLVDTVSKEPLIMDNPRCRSFFIRALDYHLVPERRMQCGNPATDFPREKTTRFVYVVGGENRIGCLNTVERYDVSSREWKDFVPMIQRRKYPAAAVLDGILYVTGGIDENGHDLSTVERFDPTLKTWQYVSSLEKCRGAVGVAVLDGWLYAAGGSHGGSSIRSVERYDPVRDEWAQVSQMRFPRSYFGLAVYGGKLYAVGGYCGICEIEHCEVYDPIGNHWKDIADLNKARMKHGVSSHGDRIFAVGGCCSSTVLDSIEKYNLGLNMWLIIKHTLDPRMGTGISTVTTNSDEQDLMILGGLDSNHMYNNSTKLVNLQSIEYCIKPGLPMGEARVFCGSSSY